MSFQSHYIIYNGEGVIQGISHNCSTSFGILSSLIEGNTTNANEFTIDAIAPEIMDSSNSDELKGPGGIIVNFDTTQIQQNFLLGQGESDEESEGNEEGEQLNYQYLDENIKFYGDIGEKNINIGKLKSEHTCLRSRNSETFVSILLSSRKLTNQKTMKIRNSKKLIRTLSNTRLKKVNNRR